MSKPQFDDKFINRHIGPRDFEIEEMLKVVGADSLDDLMDKTIPESIRMNSEMKLDEPLTEFEMLSEIKKIASENDLYKNYIGMGYYPTILPPVIQRNILENPGWYTQYTPYQAEISQGRLEALLNFQTLITEMTGLPIANASLLDEGTAVAEAMLMSRANTKNKTATKIFVSEKIFPQTKEVLKNRAVPRNIEVVFGDFHNIELDESYFAAILQYPDNEGNINDYSGFIEKAHSKKLFVIISADLLSLALLTPPGEIGADVVVGSTQRFGVPMMYGGPHAAFFATKEEFKRIIPGRIIGISIDKNGNKAYRMALQTREQHIKREKATSNICTAQVLLAIMAATYAVYHGPEGIKAIALRIHQMAKTLDTLIKNAGFKQTNELYFDTLCINVSKEESKKIRDLSESQKINFRYFGDNIGISLSEITQFDDILEIANIFGSIKNISYKLKDIIDIYEKSNIDFGEKFTRKSKILKAEVFNKYHSETELLRYLKSLENKDLSLTGSMIPLGSCTMKLNATAEMLGITNPGFTDIHPYAPLNQAKGYMRMIKKLGEDLCEITGFSGITFQPNSGAQGEYTGLMIIRQYHISRNEGKRDIVLIPSSAHGTNPASAVMAGMKVVVVNCDENGNIDVNDLKTKSEQYKENLAALMVTYPSTHGVFEESIIDICRIIHENGGQVYMDGANMNAQVGITSPALIGADCCHLNLHKTFTIPHGGGGPGVGPVAVAKHLVPFLPSEKIIDDEDKNTIGAVSSAPFGSAGILAIPYAYIKMTGAEGLKKSTQVAILNANYIKEKLKNDFKVLYTGKNGMVAHELIFDMQDFKHKFGIDVEDIAKRLMDYGFHAPTVSFPVHGTFMVEPTESEPKSELDRFIEAMLSIRNEIRMVEEGKISPEDNPLKNAPHTALEISSEEWNHPYSRMTAAFPVDNLRNNKYWPAVARINNAYGDRNLVCSCPPVSEYNDN